VKAARTSGLTKIEFTTNKGRKFNCGHDTKELYSITSSGWHGNTLTAASGKYITNLKQADSGTYLITGKVEADNI